MILFFLVNQILACEFEFIYREDRSEVSYDIPQAEFIAFGIWTRYYAFYLDILVQPEQYQYFDQTFEAYQIMKGSYVDGTSLQYFMIKQSQSLSHFFILNSDYYQQNLKFKNFFNDESYEGVWVFTYMGFDKNQKGINIILVNTKTDQFEQQYYDQQVQQINQIHLFGYHLNTQPFSGEISFTYSQNKLVQFNNGEQLVNYLKFCKTDNSCIKVQRMQILSGILDTLYYPKDIKMQNNYWIDGWFIFTPTYSMKFYNHLILWIVQQDYHDFEYNGIIPLQIILNFDYWNLSNNGIIVETTNYTKPIWNDNSLNSIRIQIFNQEYLKLLQSWVYFRFLQYDQIDHNAEFYLSFSDSSYFNKNMGKINLFKYGEFFIYLGQSQVNKNIFIGQIANINFQTCLQTYPQAKKGQIFFLSKNFTDFQPINSLLFCQIQIYGIIFDNMIQGQQNFIYCRFEIFDGIQENYEFLIQMANSANHVSLIINFKQNCNIYIYIYQLLKGHLNYLCLQTHKDYKPVLLELYDLEIFQIMNLRDQALNINLKKQSDYYNGPKIIITMEKYFLTQQYQLVYDQYILQFNRRMHQVEAQKLILLQSSLGIIIKKQGIKMRNDNIKTLFQDKLIICKPDTAQTKLILQRSIMI